MSMPERSTNPTKDSVLPGTSGKCGGHSSGQSLSNLEKLKSSQSDAKHEEVKEVTHDLTTGNEAPLASQSEPFDTAAGDDPEMQAGPLSGEDDATVANQTHDTQFDICSRPKIDIESTEHSEARDQIKHLSTNLHQPPSPTSVQTPKSRSSPTISPSPTLESRSPPNAAFSSNRVSSAEEHEVSLASFSRTSSELDTGTKKSEIPNVIDDEDSRSEIQSIIDQFDDRGYSSEDQDNAASRTDLDLALLTNPFQPPPRKSSLEHLRSRSPTLRSRLSLSQSSPVQSSPHDVVDTQGKLDHETDPVGPQLHSSSFPLQTHFNRSEGPTSPRSSISLHKSLPPAPDPEPDLPFDFHRFLDQLRHRTADPVAKFLRSFLMEFGKKQWMVHEQIKIINDFLTFITTKMAQCDVWREVSDAEFDNAKEGMEKLVMNRLYSQIFSPAIPPPPQPPSAKGKRKPIEKNMGPGRKGQHQEDIERDDVLAQKVRIYGWVREEHLDIPPVGDSGKRFLSLAQQGELIPLMVQIESQTDDNLELLKIKSYRAPRDKVICVLNCCKVIFGMVVQVTLPVVAANSLGLLRNAKSADTSADSFVPLLIYVVLQANPDHLVSNIQYIMRFRNQDKLGGEAGYYLSSLVCQVHQGS